jgi:hypothetical protein
MIAPPKPPAQDDPEALIKEARARQRRRQATAAAMVALASVAAFVGYSLNGGNAAKLQSNSEPLPSAASASATACSRGKPRLLLSRRSGPAGTVVSVTGCGCPNTEGQTDQLSWFNTGSERALSQHRGDAYRRIPLVRSSRMTARATFVVQRSDSLGRGLLDMWCGNGNCPGNAIGHFTVTH